MKSNIESEKVISYLQCEAKADLYTDEQGSPRITTLIENRARTEVLDSPGWESLLRSLLRKKLWTASDRLLEEITFELVSLARSSEVKKRVYVRAAFHEHSVIIDHGDNEIGFTKITNEGFVQLKHPPVPMERPANQRPLPKPNRIERKKFLKLFRKWFPFSEAEQLLLLTFILKTLHCNEDAFVMLLVAGPAGAGKTTLCEKLKKIIDPCVPTFLSPPRNMDDLLVGAFHSYLLIFDNLSGIDGQIADYLCRMVYGDGISKRAHYKNHAQATYHIHRPFILNGIDELTSRHDFLDRTITIKMPEISPEQRVSQTQIKSGFDLSIPDLLGGLFALLSDCMQLLPAMPTSGLPRMTEFARMGLALEQVLDLKAGTFLSSYDENKREQTEDAFWNDDLCANIFKALENPPSRLYENGKLQGTASELMDLLFRKSKNGPRTLSGFSRWLTRVEPMLKSKGILVSSHRTSAKRTIAIYFENAPNGKTQSHGYLEEEDDEFNPIDAF